MDPPKTDLLSYTLPFLMKNCLDWKIVNWKIEDWKQCFSEKESKHSVRKGSNSCCIEPQWERYCKSVNMTINEFLELFDCDKVSRVDDWYYLDYKHIAEWFMDVADNMDISWKLFGFPDKTAKDSTIWMGTTGAHTPCHMDTYGCNLVAQLYGRKRWILVSPKETLNMQPTRVPYEESSVYSKNNFFCGCSDFSDLKEIRYVELQPGDVLYVPQHWWHYVENLTPAISVNMWIPMKEDDDSRLEESLVKIFVASACKSMGAPDISKILNPNEDDLMIIEKSRLFEELNWCLKQQKSNTTEFHCNIKISEENIVPSISSQQLAEILKDKCKNPIKRQEVETKISSSDIINAFCHPDVITLVRQKLEQAYLLKR